jgi:hypothetical protein
LNKASIAASYTQSLLLVAFFAAVAISVALAGGPIVFYIVHGTQVFDGGRFTKIAVLPGIAAIKIIGTFLIFGLPQLFQAMAVSILMRRFGSKARFAVLLLLPLTAVVTWYCYWYLTPTDYRQGINVPQDWLPFTLGASSLGSYVMALKFQAAVTVFSFLYFEAGVRGMPRTLLALLALSITIAISAIWAYQIY